MRGLGLRALAGNFGRTLVRQLGAGFATFISTWLIAIAYGPEGNGVYAVVLLLPTMLSTLLNLGIGAANIYFIGSRRASPQSAILANIWIGVGLSILGLAIGSSIIALWGTSLFPGVAETLLWISLPIFPLSLLTGCFTSIFQALQDFKTFNRLLLLAPFSFLGCLVVSYICKILTGFEILIWTQLFANVVVFLVTAFESAKLYRSDRLGPELSVKSYVKLAIGYGWKANLGSVLALLNYRADLFLLNYFLSPELTGIYIIAVSLAEKLWIASGAISTVLLPRLAELTTDEESRRQLTPLISRWVLAFTFLAGFGLVASARVIIEVAFGAGYLDALTPLLILLPGVILLAGAKVWANDIAARGRPELNMYLAFVSLTINIIGNVYLIPWWGISGAAAATTLAYSVSFIGTLLLFSNLASSNWKESLFLCKADIKELRKFMKIV